MTSVENANADQIRASLDEVLTSPALARSPALSRLLRFVVEHDLSGETPALKETVIGHVLFGREPNYDTKIDAVVRVNATRLRLRLEEHYRFREGRHAAVRITLPKGSYVPVYDVRRPCGADEELSSAGKIGSEFPPGFDSADPVPAALHDTSFVPVPVTALSSRKLWLTGGFAVLCLCIAVVVLVHRPRPIAAAEIWTERPFSKLGGLEQFPAFSPDGRRVAFAWNKIPHTPPALYVQNLGSDTPELLTHDAAGETRPAWSPDGKRMAFIQPSADGSKGVVVLNLADNKETLLATLRGSDPWLCRIPHLSWSPDSREIYTSAAGGTQAVAADAGADKRCGIVSIELSSGAVRALTQSPLDTLEDVEPAVSPDGQTVAFLRETSNAAMDVYLLHAHAGGMPERITFEQRDIGGVAWEPGGTTLLFALRGADGVTRLVDFDLKTRTLRPLTEGGSRAAFPSVAANGDHIAFSAYQSASILYRESAGKQETLVDDQSYMGSAQPSPDGRFLAYTSDRSGYVEIWIADANGQHRRRLTHSGGTGAQSPSWSPNGKDILYECRDRGHSELCIIAADGSTSPRHLTSGKADQVYPSWSRSGQAVYYSSNRSGQAEIYRQALQGGPPVQITVGGGWRAVESSDGKEVYIDPGTSGAGFFRIPVGRSMVATNHLTADNRSFLMPELAGLRSSAWDAGSNGLIFCRHLGERNEIVRFDPARRKLEVLFLLQWTAVVNRLSVDPDGSSVVLATAPSISADVQLLERGPARGAMTSLR